MLERYSERELRVCLVHGAVLGSDLYRASSPDPDNCMPLWTDGKYHTLSEFVVSIGSRDAGVGKLGDDYIDLCTRDDDLGDVPRSDGRFLAYRRIARGP